MRVKIAMAVLASGAAVCSATPVLVEIEGDVWGNQIGSGLLGSVQSGERALISFMLSSEDYLDSASFPTRGYSIDPASFSLSFSGGTTIGLSPSLSGPAYFVVRDNDPAVDGFFLSMGTDWPTALDLDQEGAFGNFGVRFNVTYTGDTLDSLDILDAGGSYDYAGLSVFGMGVSDGPFEDVLGMDFSSMTITVIPAPATALALVPLVLAGRRRR